MLKRLLVAAVAALILVPAARAHFIFVIPDGANKATVVLSEGLEPDAGVNAKLFAGTKLTARAVGGKDTALTTTAKEHALSVEVPGDGPRVIFGTTDLGVRQRGDNPAFRLVYYPKAVLGRADDALVTLGSAVPAELVPVGQTGAVRFKLLAAGKPVADAEVTVIPPSGGEGAKVKTDKDGLTPEYKAAGRYGAWSRVVETKSGELDGKKYDTVRHYPTLVVDVAGPGLPPLPKAVSSLGAIACDGYVYIYGGHSGTTHKYDTASVIGTFHRLKLEGGTAWEELPGGPILQGMNLATHGGKVYRVGGMQPRNKPDEPADNLSVADCARFDPATKKWEPIAPLPAGRSSHDVVVAGDKLVVVGGWQMKGAGEQPVWHDTVQVLDLSANGGQWKAIPQPFKRRALTAAAVGSKVYVLAGMGEKGADSHVDILDVATGQWSAGPALPGKTGNAFSPAATVVDGRLVVNTSAGPVFRLTAGGDGWEKVGEVVTKRRVGRLVPYGTDAVVVLGGAGGGGNVAAVEEVRLAAKGEPVTVTR
ncbi:hypothetical protein [Fimbriiglobus ruber]|uniref:Ring canal kelch-like protein n=1 Tax=Fimbriiglobus ruber TaxID=1908690 RepID=A0A225DF70_9BACT|nr:hypothetical protein [Fimbriiglobus ruber]OWK35799.1 Ring canal kelch-like protein [Fimbriiglobus ruber]